MSLNALVTGATSGIGRAIATQAIEQGYTAIGVGRDFSKNDLNFAQAITLDQSDLGAVDAFCKEHRSLLSGLDLLVLNAGYGQFGAIEQFSTAQIEKLITTNLTSNIVLLSKIVPLMKAKGGGDIVLIGSEAALQGAKQGSVYCASKFGLRGLAQSLRAECANSGIRVILINPGAVRSDFFDELAFEPAQGQEFALSPQDIASSVFSALKLPATSVVDELNLQPLKRVFKKS